MAKITNTSWKSAQDIAIDMIAEDRDRNEVFDKIDKRIHCDWLLPEEWRTDEEMSWVKPIISAEPLNAITIATRILGTNEPQLVIHPLYSNAESIALTNTWEKVLMWHYRRANLRRKSSITRELVHSALRYDMIAATVFDLAHLSLDSKRKKRANLNGRFSVPVYIPANVHALFSDYMLERVLLCENKKAHEVVSFYGEGAKKLRDKITKDDGTIDTTINVVHYDYWDDTYRFVWDEVEGGEKIRVKMDDEHKLPFIPWIVASGGSELESESKFQMEPLLFNDVRSNEWETQNLFGSLMYSLAAFRSAAPVDVSKTIQGEGVDVSYKEAGGQVQLKTGQEYQRLAPPQFDPTIKEMYDRLASGISKGSGTRVLQIADIPQGTAYATYNAVVQSGLNAIDNYKSLAERALADVFQIMLNWVKYTGEPLYAYQDNKKMPMYGGQLALQPEVIPDEAYIEVRLKPKVTSNRVQEINAANMMVQGLMYPQARALEDLNVPDSDTAFDEWKTEQLNKAAVQAEAQAIVQKSQMALQLQMQQLAMQQQQAQTQGPPTSQQPGTVAQAPFAGTGMMQPGMGGMSPVAAAPETMREQITGQPKAAMIPEE